MLKPGDLHFVPCFLCLLLNLTSLPNRCHAANRYCVNGHTLPIGMDGFDNKDETIIPDILDEPISQRGSYHLCRWEIIAEPKAKNLQLVLVAASQKNDNKTVPISLQFPVSSFGAKAMQNVTRGMFQVMPLSQSKHFSVEIKWDPATEARRLVNLRVLIPVPKFCSKDMLGFRSNCLAVNPVEMNATEALCSCYGDAQLASFTSMTDITDFIAANDARLNDFPYQRPLDLGQEVRIGLFYDATDGSGRSVVRVASNCSLTSLPPSQSQEMLTAKPTGACGSLRVNESGQAEVRFVPCNKPMPTLVTFPEIATQDRAECSNSLTPLVKKLEGAFREGPKFPSEGSPHGAHPDILLRVGPLSAVKIASPRTTSILQSPDGAQSKTILIAASSAASVLICNVLLVTVIIAKRWRLRKRSASDSLDREPLRVNSGGLPAATLASNLPIRVKPTAGNSNGFAGDA